VTTSSGSPCASIATEKKDLAAVMSRRFDRSTSTTWPGRMAAGARWWRQVYRDEQHRKVRSHDVTHRRQFIHRAPPRRSRDLDHSSFGCREADPEQAPVLVIPYIDLAGVGLDQTSRDRESEPAPTAEAASRGIASKRGLEDAVYVGRRHLAAFVEHREHDCVSVAVRRAERSRRVR
jgi:hypothetical protein